MIDADRVWERIVRHSGDEFRLMKRRPFTYTATGRTIQLHSTNRMISRTAIEKALALCPLENTVPAQGPSVPSYICASRANRTLGAP
jgi:hypothetical protein